MYFPFLSIRLSHSFPSNMTLIRSTAVILLSSVFFPSSISAFSTANRFTYTITTRGLATTSWILFAVNANRCETTATDPMTEHYRQDGVRITHDPYEPGMAEKYGLPGQTDPEGFDPYSGTVGPGIYGGSVQRNVN
jgi:hypothetical protein